jgi:peroxiredoxin
MKRWGAGIWALALILGLSYAMTGCSGDDEDGPIVSPRAPCVPAEEQSPQLQLSDLDGNEYDIKDDLCEKVVLLHFSATWCPACGLGLDRMQEFHESYAEQGLRVMAVNMLEDAKRVRRYFEEQGVTFPVLLDQFGTYTTFWDIQVIPTYVLISREGVEVVRIPGYGEEELDGLEAEIRSQLK